MMFNSYRPARFLTLAAAALAVSALSARSDAGVVALGGGWQAEWDSSLDGFVDIQVDAISGNNIFIQKSAQFTQPPSGGLFAPIPIVFRQVAASTIMHIVIEDEIITNQTGSPWTDFHMDILDSGDASFNPAMTAASGGPGPIGFNISPFTTASFTPDNMSLNIGGGVVANGQTWFPGRGSNDGQLWINVNSHTTMPYTVFTLKETPTPTPGVLALLGVAGMLGRSRRRR